MEFACIRGGQNEETLRTHEISSSDQDRRLWTERLRKLRRLRLRADVLRMRPTEILVPKRLVAASQLHSVSE